MRIGEARALTKQWQKILGLDHWAGKIRWAKPGEGCEECYGLIEWWTEEATFTMILNRSRANEETIIHELGHLTLEGSRPRPFPYSSLYEQGINRLSSLLLRAKPCLMAE